MRSPFPSLLISVGVLHVTAPTLYFVIGALAVVGCSLDDRTLIETDENGRPITGDGDGDGDGDGTGGGGTGGGSTGGQEGSGGSTVIPGETCGEGPGWINDSIGTSEDPFAAEWRGEVWAQKSGTLSSISPTSFESSPACMSGTVEPGWWAAFRWNIAQEFLDDCVPESAGTTTLPEAGGVRFAGSSDVSLRIAVTTGVEGSAAYWCYVVPEDVVNAGSFNVTWDQLTRECDAGPGGDAYAGEPVTTIQVEPNPGGVGDFEFCVDALVPF